MGTGTRVISCGTGTWRSTTSVVGLSILHCDTTDTYSLCCVLGLCNLHGLLHVLARGALSVRRDSPLLHSILQRLDSSVTGCCCAVGVCLASARQSQPSSGRGGGFLGYFTGPELHGALLNPRSCNLGRHVYDLLHSRSETRSSRITLTTSTVFSFSLRHKDIHDL